MKLLPSYCDRNLVIYKLIDEALRKLIGGASDNTHVSPKIMIFSKISRNIGEAKQRLTSYKKKQNCYIQQW
jgi:hypothetical protein